MGPTAIAAIVIVLVSAGASFFFALAETALFSLSQWQVRQLADRDPRSGGIVARLLADPQDLLATMVLGNTFASAAMLAVAFWMALHDRWPTIPTILGLLALTLFGCEVLPKTLAGAEAGAMVDTRGAPADVPRKSSAFRCAEPRRESTGPSLPLWCPRPPQPSPGLTDEEYQELLEMAYQQGTLAQSEKENHSAGHHPRPAHGEGSDESPLPDGCHIRRFVNR
jgi:putative hemolysin